MATGTDRYAPLRDGSPETPNKSQEPSPTQEVDNSRAMPSNQSPGWTHEGGMVEQQKSAMEWVKASHERKVAARNEADRDAPAPQGDEKRPLAFFEDKEKGRNYSELKAQQAQAVAKEREGDEAKEKKDGQRELTFYEDRDQDKDHDQGHSR